MSAREIIVRLEPQPQQIERVAKRLLALLPGLYRGKDKALPGEPLAKLLGVVARELARFENAVRALDDDHFVERASPEALPLLAELLGVHLLGKDPRINRGLLARSVGWRRRRGTPATLVEMLSVTSGYAVDVHEGYRSLMVTYDFANPIPTRGTTTRLVDPIVLADPIARRNGEASSTLLVKRANETVDDALRRLGRVDAGRPPVSPRTPDFLGWARPEAILARAAELVGVELDELPCPVHVDADGRRTIALDPLGRATTIVWPEPGESPEVFGALTQVHEPEHGVPAPVRRSSALLTPTALAANPNDVEASGALILRVEGVPLLGSPRVREPSEPLGFMPLGVDPKLRLADPSRPSEGDAFTLELFAAQSDEGPLDLVPDVEGNARDVLIASTTIAPNMLGEVVTTSAAERAIGGASVLLRATRTAGLGARRAASGAWTTFDPGPRSGSALGNATLVSIAGTATIVRPERVPTSTAIHLGALAADGSSPWRQLTIAGAPEVVSGIAVTSFGDTIYLVVPDASGSSLSVWSVTTSPSIVATRLDDPTQTLRPIRREQPAVLVHDDKLYLFGGARDGAALGDLWSFSLVDHRFRPIVVRHPQTRAAASLLWQFGGLVLLGGESTPGLADATSWWVDLARPRPTWTSLPSLPIAASAPGRVIARPTATGIEALLWADRTRPMRAVMGADRAAWSVGALEPSPAPNPPAEGEALFVGDEIVVVAPSPLPPSEVIFTLNGKSRLAFLPALDLARDESVLLTIADDGSTRARLFSSEESPGRLPYAERASRDAGELRIGVPGRLAFMPYTLRQRIYGAWPTALAFPDRDDVIGLDPRTGCVALPKNAPAGVITATFRVGRGAAIGAGCMPQARRLPWFWEEPGDPAPTPPDLRPGVAPNAYVDPPRAGASLLRLDASIPLVASPPDALAASVGVDHAVVGILGSPSFGPTTLAGGGGRGLSLVAIDHAHAPLFFPDAAGGDAAALGVYPDFGGSTTTEVHLAGLWIAGRLDLVLARGVADVRWCTLGQPGAIGVRVPGGGDDAPANRTPLEPEVEVRLYGCVVGAIELPPWVRLIAAGCTFDGGLDGRAIRAAGAEVRLRQCTTRGSVVAGRLFASSCAFGGPVRATRPDEGYIRYSVLPRAAGQPTLHRCVDQPVSFASTRPTDPSYLVLAANNGAAVLRAGELERIPGAHGERSDRLRELVVRGQSHLPVGMTFVHHDRVPNDLARMGRSSQ